MKIIGIILFCLLCSLNCGDNDPELRGNECVRAIAEAQLRAVAEVAARGGDVESEIRQRSNITAGYVEDICLSK